MASQHYFLLTFWGTVVCSGGKHPLSHLRLSEIDGDCNPTPFHTSGRFLQSGHNQADRFEYFRTSPYSPVSLRKNSLYLCAGDHTLVSPSRSTAGGWEWFILLSPDDLDALRTIVASSWIEVSTNELCRADTVEILQEFRLKIGQSVFSLLDNVPFNLPGPPYQAAASTDRTSIGELTLRSSHWKMHRYRQFRPLIFYCAFGRSSLGLLRESARSLKAACPYPIDVLVATSASRADVKACFEGHDDSRLHVWNTDGSDVLDYCAARYRVAQWLPAHDFQPLLYVDTDIVFDRDPESMLLDIVNSPRLTAQEEPFADLRHWVACGAQLFAEAGIAVDGRRGFNTGAIGIPSIRRHAATLGEIYQTIYGYIDAKSDRNALPQFDQPVANYVAVVTESFDVSVLTSYVRWFQDDVFGGGNSPAGLCHFWGTLNKREEMSKYIDSLSSTDLSGSDEPRLHE